MASIWPVSVTARRKPVNLPKTGNRRLYYFGPTFPRFKTFFHKTRGRLFGTYVADGLILDIYFTTKAATISINGYRIDFVSFVDEFTTSCTNRGENSQKNSWLICGTDTNAHFAGCGSPTHPKDDWAALE